MKKTLLPLLVLMLLMLVFSGCGKTASDDLSAAGAVSATFEIPETPAPTAEPTAEPTPEPTPEPTAQPTPEPTAEPDEPAAPNTSNSSSGGSSSGGSSSGGSSSGGGSTATKAPDPTEPPEDTRTPYEIADSMTGSSVSSLIAAIGSPNSSEYSESCLAPDGQDGWLYYSGFTVTTLKYSDGTEIVMGAY